MVTERFIQFVWQHGLFNKESLQTIHSEPIKILKLGYLNVYDGPDFSDARIQIGDLEWAGTIEIHVKDVDWLSHGHQNDTRYNNVILHVVWEIKNQESVPKGVPCLVLKEFVSEDLIEKYEKLLSGKNVIPCTDSISKVSELEKQYTLEKMAFNRIDRKSMLFYEVLKDFEFDWRQMLFYLFALAIGKKANKSLMHQFASSMDVKILLKHKDQKKSLEAMVFGSVGLLDANDVYSKDLLNEFKFLQQKYGLTEFEKNQWNFSKVRGVSKPYLGMALLVSVLESMDNMVDHYTFEETFLNSLSIGPYWEKHNSFGNLSKRKNTISLEMKNHLKINVLTPYLFLLSKYYDDENYLIKAQEILESINAEANSIVDKMISLGFKVKNGFESQGAIELHNEFCANKRCLECHAGRIILGRK